MTNTLKVSLNDTELKSLSYATVSPLEWLQNAIAERARIARDEIVAKVVAHCNDNAIQLATGADAQVAQAFDLGIVKTAADMQAAMDDEFVPAPTQEAG